mgnify:CR=1 FL=1
MIVITMQDLLWLALIAASIVLVVLAYAIETIKYVHNRLRPNKEKEKENV